MVDPSTIGVPVGENDTASAELVAVRASRHGCTIAARTQDKLFVTWDGGQTFVEHAMTGMNDIAASSGRVAIIRNRRDLGVVRAGETEITWRSVPPFARRDGDIDTVVEIAAAGAWTVLVEGRLIAATDDDVRTWRYLTAPVDRRDAHVELPARHRPELGLRLEREGGGGARRPTVRDRQRPAQPGLSRQPRRER